MLELRNNTYVDTVFFLAGPNYDWLAFVFRQGDGPWEACHRIRLVRDDKTWGSSDVKKFFTVKLSPDAEPTRDGLRHAIANLAVVTTMVYGAPHIIDSVLVEGGADAFVEAMSDKGWCHVGRAKKGENFDDTVQRLKAEEAVAKAAPTGEA